MKMMKLKMIMKMKKKMNETKKSTIPAFTKDDCLLERDVSSDTVRENVCHEK
jgi:hypothetical protein